MHSRTDAARARGSGGCIFANVDDEGGDQCEESCWEWRSERCSRSWWQRRRAPCRRTRSSSPRTCSGSASCRATRRRRWRAAPSRPLAAKGSHYVTKAPLGTRLASKSLGRYLAARVVDPSATRTYATNALVLLVEFGDAAWPDGDSTGHVLAGPEHGSIPAPYQDDNFTFWPGDFTPMHYQQMLFGNSYPIYDQNGARRGTSDDTMRNYYLEQSHGTYTVSGDIADWVQLDLPESYYGADSDPFNSTDDLTGPVWRVARDAIVKFATDNPGFDWSQYDQENPWGITGAGLRAARRLPRPPHPHPRRQRPVGRRRRRGRRRHLGALLGHLRELQRWPRRRPRHDDPGHRRAGPAGQGHLGLQLHDQSRGRRRRRVLPRVRSRPRPLGPVRLLERHGRRDQRLLDDHGQRLLARA